MCKVCNSGPYKCPKKTCEFRFDTKFDLTMHNHYWEFKSKWDAVLVKRKVAELAEETKLKILNVGPDGNYVASVPWKNIQRNTKETLLNLTKRYILTRSYKNLELMDTKGWKLGLFNKKTKKDTGKSIEVLRLNLDDFPEEALKLTYMDMMEKYTDKPSSRLQKIMVHISKELNKRANTNIDEAQVEITVSQEEPKKTKPEQLTEKRIEQIVERKEKKQTIFSKPISQVLKKKETQKVEKPKTIQKKPKKSFGSFFKKKVPVFVPSKVTIAEEIQNHPNIQQEANKIRKLEEQLDSYEKEYGSVD